MSWLNKDGYYRCSSIVQTYQMLHTLQPASMAHDACDTCMWQQTSARQLLNCSGNDYVCSEIPTVHLSLGNTTGCICRDTKVETCMDACVCESVKPQAVEAHRAAACRRNQMSIGRICSYAQGEWKEPKYRCDIRVTSMTMYLGCLTRLFDRGCCESRAG